jgi:group I intron endonuclease
MALTNTPLAELLAQFLMLIYSLLLIEESNVEFLQTYDVLLSFFVPIMIYSNADTDKSRILSDLKGVHKTGIYMWSHKESGRVYVGSAVELSLRLGYYYTPSWLKQADITRALILHTHSAFCLSILMYIDISNLDKEKARLLILESEQFYLDLIFSLDEPNTYNLLKVAGSSLGITISAETKALMSEAHKGKTHSTETKAKISEAMSGENNPMYGKSGENHPMFGKTGENNPMFGKNHSGVNNPMFGKTHSMETLVKMSNAKSSENNPMFGKCHSTDTKALMSIAKGGSTIYVYDSQGSLVNTFSSARNAAVEYDTTRSTATGYVKNGKLFQEQWFLSLSAK